MLLLGGCAGTRLDIHGDVGAPSQDNRARIFTALRGTLTESRRLVDAQVQVDTSFVERGFDARRPPLVVVPGGALVLAFADDEARPNARLFLELPPHLARAGAVLGDGDFIPYLDLHLELPGPGRTAQLFTAICKGGRGRLSVERASPGDVGGSLALVVSCRTYVDGYEREEAELSVTGEFLVSG